MRAASAISANTPLPKEKGARRAPLQIAKIQPVYRACGLAHSAVALSTSIVTPGPMVEESDTCFM